MTKIECAHAEELTRVEAAQHVGCTPYGRPVNPRTIDRWADDPYVPIERYKLGGRQWVRFKRTEIDAAVTALLTLEPVGQWAKG